MSHEERRGGEACCKCGSATKALVDGKFCGTCRWDLIESIKQRASLIALYRVEDESGVSGEGLVAIGVTLPDGGVVMQWLNGANENVDTTRNGWSIYPGEEGMDDMMEVHGHGGRTKLIILADSAMLTGP